MNTTDTTVTSHEGNETADTDIDYTQPELTDADNETPIFVQPTIPPMKEPGIPICDESLRNVLKTKQDAIWVEDASGQWALDFDFDQPDVHIKSIDYIEGIWKAKGEHEGSEYVWFGPKEESASTGQFTDPKHTAPTFTASRIIQLPARATQSDVLSPNGKRVATISAVRNAIKNSDIKDLPKKIAYTTDSKGKLTALTIGSRTSATVGSGSLVNGESCTAQGVCAHAEGNVCSATADYSHAEGNKCSATADYSHAEGLQSSASGICSHAEGRSSTSAGSYAYANGFWAFANGDYSFALGYKVKTGEDAKSGSRAFAWNGDATIEHYFSSHGEGSFNINPKGGVLGFYIGDLNLQQIIDARVKELVKATAADADE